MVKRREFIERSGACVLLYLLDPKEAFGVVGRQQEQGMKEQEPSMKELKEKLMKQEKNMDTHYEKFIEIDVFEELENQVKYFKELSGDYEVAKESYSLLKKKDYSGFKKKVEGLEQILNHGECTAKLVQHGVGDIREVDEQFRDKIKSILAKSENTEEEIRFLSTIIEELVDDLKRYSHYSNFVNRAFSSAKEVAGKKAEERIYADTEQGLHKLSIILIKEKLDRYVEVYSKVEDIGRSARGVEYYSGNFTIDGKLAEPQKLADNENNVFTYFQRIKPFLSEKGYPDYYMNIIDKAFSMATKIRDEGLSKREYLSVDKKLDELRWHLLRRFDVNAFSYLKIDGLRMGFNKMGFLRNYFSAEQEFNNAARRKELVDNNPDFFESAKNTLLCFKNIESIMKRVKDYELRTNWAIEQEIFKLYMRKYGKVMSGRWISWQRYNHFEAWSDAWLKHLKLKLQEKAKADIIKHFQSLKQEV
ncbi:hypothetical protein KY348_01550 [Candidatus Woesearchaeota archaeon]|nr:hypothetical protein [Candidatus Woesearchaeota archaeon]